MTILFLRTKNQFQIYASKFGRQTSNRIKFSFTDNDIALSVLLTNDTQQKTFKMLHGECSISYGISCKTTWNMRHPNTI